MLACIRVLQAVPLIGILHIVLIVGVEGKPQAGPASETLTRVESPVTIICHTSQSGRDRLLEMPTFRLLAETLLRENEL